MSVRFSSNPDSSWPIYMKTRLSFCESLVAIVRVVHKPNHVLISLTDREIRQPYHLRLSSETSLRFSRPCYTSMCRRGVDPSKFQVSSTKKSHNRKMFFFGAPEPRVNHGYTAMCENKTFTKCSLISLQNVWSIKLQGHCQFTRVDWYTCFGCRRGACMEIAEDSKLCDLVSCVTKQNRYCKY